MWSPCIPGADWLLWGATPTWALPEYHSRASSHETPAVIPTCKELYKKNIFKVESFYLKPFFPGHTIDVVDDYFTLHFFVVSFQGHVYITQQSTKDTAFPACWHFELLLRHLMFFQQAIFLVLWGSWLYIITIFNILHFLSFFSMYVRM